MIAGGVYVTQEGWQPTVVGALKDGELVWTLKMKSPDHLKKFPVRYRGDFSEQWMRLSLYEKGYTWDAEESQ